MVRSKEYHFLLLVSWLWSSDNVCSLFCLQSMSGSLSSLNQSSGLCSTSSDFETKLLVSILISPWNGFVNKEALR